MILFHTLVSSPGWQVLAASELAAYRVVTRAVNVNLMLIFTFASSLQLRTPASGADRPLIRIKAAGVHRFGSVLPPANEILLT